MKYTVTSTHTGQRYVLNDSDAFHRALLQTMRQDADHWTVKPFQESPDNNELWEIYLRQVQQ